ncbi:hypothetical protein F7D13_12215 [Methylocystis rosea]|uniref:Uncharacterized protein n=1 Tax=Methylocystis rosea TaxID=173366 RepID=A0ABX6EIY6_9HYPH|nr:hypothetical protein [Methylocystis rosea]QGM94722.1 hypothetical protein F7D13_12215 [Methylocystis rosea]
MIEAEKAALGLLAEMRQTLAAMHTEAIAKDNENSSLKEQLATFQTADAQIAVAQERDWFEAFHAAVFPPSVSVEPSTEETVA